MKYKVVVAWKLPTDVIPVLCDMPIWCRKNIGIFGVDWKRVCGVKRNEEHQYFFLTEESLFKFSLTWGDYII